MRKLLTCSCQEPILSRRDMLRQMGAGFGSLALAALLAEDAAATATDPLAVKPLTSLPKPNA